VLLKNANSANQTEEGAIQLEIDPSFQNCQMNVERNSHMIKSYLM
jgi:hypothetical protein